MSYIDLKSYHHSSEMVFAQFNIKLERGIKPNCDICLVPYTVFNREHVCKRCLRSVCAECSPFKVKTYLANRGTRLHRNCSICHAESLLIQKYIEENKLSLRQDSDLLLIWSKALSGRKGVKVARSKSSLKNYVELDNLWGSFNFSFREFIGRVVEKSSLSDADLINLIGNGLEEIENHSRDRLEEGLYIYLFFLCHADVEAALNLTIFLLELLEKSPTKHTLKKAMQGVGFSEVEAYKVEEFLLDNEAPLKDGAAVNFLPVTAAFEVVNALVLTSNVTSLWRALLLFFFQRKEVVLKNLNKINAIRLDLLRNPKVVNLKALLKAEPSTEEEDAKYSKLLNEYKHLLAHSEKLEKELSEDRTLKNKILTDSLLEEDVTSHSHSFKREEFNQILEAKNEEIIKTKMRNEELETQAKLKAADAETYFFENLELKSELAEKDKKLAKLEEERNSLKKVNGLLLEKMRELSKMLMDQEEKEILKNDKVLEAAIQDYPEQKQEDCAIY